MKIMNDIMGGSGFDWGREVVNIPTQSSGITPTNNVLEYNINGALAEMRIRTRAGGITSQTTLIYVYINNEEIPTLKLRHNGSSSSEYANYCSSSMIVGLTSTKQYMSFTGIQMNKVDAINIMNNHGATKEVQLSLSTSQPTNAFNNGDVSLIPAEVSKVKFVFKDINEETALLSNSFSVEFFYFKP